MDRAGTQELAKLGVGMAWEGGIGAVIAGTKPEMLDRSGVIAGLRSSYGDFSELADAFSQVRQEFVGQVCFRVIVEGTPRSLRPDASDEVYLIGYEALSNAFRHSAASDIEVELEYSSSRLRVLIRDNGCGIAPEVFSSEHHRHWGLSDMNERARRIGGKLRVLSHAAAGTEVELTVPGAVAYEGRQEDRSARWISRLFS
jgi:signal transduction histidine kinase